MRIEEDIEVIKATWRKVKCLTATDVILFCAKHRLYHDQPEEFAVLQMHLHDILMSGADIAVYQIAEIAEDIKAHSTTKLSAADIAAKLDGLTVTRYKRPNLEEFMALQPLGSQVLTTATRLPGGAMVYGYSPVLTADQAAAVDKRIKDAFASLILKNGMAKTPEEVAALEAQKATKWGGKEVRA